MPTIDPAVPPERWTLGDEGRAGAAALAQRLPTGAYLVSSREPKARQTLEPLGAVAEDAAFNEVWRAGEPFGGNFRELRLLYLMGTQHERWEPRAEVAQRFDQGITRHIREAGDRPLVVATHGMAMTLWLTACVGLPDPGAFWSGLRFPDALLVDLKAARVNQI